MRTHVALAAVALSLTLAACGSKTVGTSSNSNPPQNNPPDTAAPKVSITSPSNSGSYSTASAAVALAGTAADNVGVASVGWRNAATGASGDASGTSSWTVANIALVSGVNTITVTARDAAGNASTATIGVTYNAPATSSLSGNVDSSLIDRSAANTVYLYNGTVTPGGNPAATTPVAQDRGACTFSYRFGAVPAGTYTVAFSSDGANFRGTATVTVAASGTADHPFPPSRRLQVGPGRTLKKPSDAAAQAQDGDVIEIDAGEYLNDSVTWTQDNLTLRGVGGRAHMHATLDIPNDKGIWVQPSNQAANLTVENIEFSGAAGPSENDAGIRADGTGLTVCNGYFHDNQNGILGGQGNVLIEYSEFDRNGRCDLDGSNCAHNMYINSAGGGGTVFTLRYSYIHRAHTGHNVKSRASDNHILYNRIMDETDGDGSYEIDLPNAGLSFIIGNLLQKGPLNDDQPAFISYGVEPGSGIHPNHELYVVNNTFVNDDTRSAEAFSIGDTFTPAIRVVNNLFVGLNEPTGTGITSTSNLVSSNPGLVDRAHFDYHLSSTSPARNAGTNPGSAGAESLVPVSQYVHPANREDRPVDVTIDVGAYEFQ